MATTVGKEGRQPHMLSIPNMRSGIAIFAQGINGSKTRNPIAKMESGSKLASITTTASHLPVKTEVSPTGRRQPTPRDPQAHPDACHNKIRKPAAIFRKYPYLPSQLAKRGIEPAKYSRLALTRRILWWVGFILQLQPVLDLLGIHGSDAWIPSRIRDDPVTYSWCFALTLVTALLCWGVYWHISSSMINISPLLKSPDCHNYKVRKIVIKVAMTACILVELPVTCIGLFFCWLIICS